MLGGLRFVCDDDVVVDSRPCSDAGRAIISSSVNVIRSRSHCEKRSSIATLFAVQDRVPRTATVVFCFDRFKADFKFHYLVLQTFGVEFFPLVVLMEEWARSSRHPRSRRDPGSRHNKRGSMFDAESESSLD